MDILSNEMLDILSQIQENDTTDIKTVVLQNQNKDKRINIQKTKIDHIYNDDSDVSDEEVIFFNDAKLF